MLVMENASTPDYIKLKHFYMCMLKDKQWYHRFFVHCVTIVVVST